MNSGPGSGGLIAAVRIESRISALLLARSFVLALALLVLSVPASARRHRRYVSHRTAGRRVTRHRVPKTGSPPTIAPVRSIVILVADGFSGSDWDAVRAARPDGFVAWDRVGFSCIAVSPKGAGLNATSFAGLLSTGVDGVTEPLPSTLVQRARSTGRSIALVSSGALTDPIPAFLAVAANQEPAPETLRRLVSQRFEALFARSVPADLSPEPSSYGYRVLTEPQAILMAETVPVLATAPPDAVPLDSMAFRALHLVAKNPRGFVMVVGASAQTCKPDEFNSVASTILRYAIRAGRTLVLVVQHSADGSTTVFADGEAAAKFRGSLLLTDIPKILAGVSAIKGFGRDFSPLFAAHAVKLAVGKGKGIVPLPW